MERSDDINSGSRQLDCLHRAKHFLDPTGSGVDLCIDDLVLGEIHDNMPSGTHAGCRFSMKAAIPSRASEPGCIKVANIVS